MLIFDSHTHTGHLDFAVLGALLDVIVEAVVITDYFCFSATTRAGKRFIRVF
jgi:hypothetical protein